MKKNLFSTLLALLTIGAMLTCVGCKNYDDDISQLNTKIASLESATAQISTLESKVTSLESSVATLNSTVSSLKSTTDANTADIDALEKSVASMNSAIDAAKSDIADLKAAVKAQISAEEVQKMIDKANAELTQKVNEALVQVADMKIVIDALPETVKAQVDAAVASIKEALGAVSGQIQSIVYVPTGAQYGIYDTDFAYLEQYYLGEDQSIYSDYMLFANYEITPAELASSITAEDVSVKLLCVNNATKSVSKIYKTPVQFSAGNGTISVGVSFTNKEISAMFANSYSAYMNVTITQDNVVDDVNYGTEIASTYMSCMASVEPTILYYTLFNGTNTWNGSFTTEVPWNEYKNSEKSVFGSYQPYLLAWHGGSNGYGVSGLFSIEEAAAILGVDAQTITPTIAYQTDLSDAEKEKFTLKKDGLASTIAVNTDKVDSDAKAKALVGETISTTLGYEIVNKGVTVSSSVTFWYPENGSIAGYNFVTGNYTVVKETTDAAVIDPVTVAWNYTGSAYQYEFKELGISKTILTPGRTYTCGIYNAKGTRVGTGRVYCEASELVNVKFSIGTFPDADAVYTLKGYLSDESTTNPFTMNINVNAKPADTKVDLGTVQISSNSPSLAKVAMLAPSFNGKEAYYLGSTDYKKEALYASLAKGEIVTDPEVVSLDNRFDITSLVIDGEEVYDYSKIEGIYYGYALDSENEVYVDDSRIVFTSAVEYGSTYTIGFSANAPWGQKIEYTVTVIRSDADAALVPTGFVKDGVVTMGGSLVNNIYTINQMTILKYLKLNVGTSSSNDFTVEFDYTTEAGVAFGDDEKNTKLGCVGTPTGLPSGVYGFDGDGNIDYTQTTSWSDYKGLYFNVSAQLYNNGVKYGDPLKFKIETAEPIQSVDYSAAINETISANAAATIWLYQNTKVYGVLDPTKNLVFYNPSVDGTVSYPWATTKLDTDGKTVVLDDPIGNRFYNQYFKFNSDGKAKVYVNGVENNFDDVATVEGYQLKIKAQSAKGTYKFEIPAQLNFMLDHDNVNAKTGTVTVNVVVE